MSGNSQYGVSQGIEEPVVTRLQLAMAKPARLCSNAASRLLCSMCWIRADDLATLERDPQELYVNSEERLGVSSPMKGKARSWPLEATPVRRPTTYFYFKRVAVEVKPSCCKMQKFNSNPFILELLTGAHLAHVIREVRKADSQDPVRPQSTKRH